MIPHFCVLPFMGHSLAAAGNMPFFPKLVPFFIIAFIVIIIVTIAAIPILYNRRIKARNRMLSGYIMQDPKLAQTIREQKNPSPKPDKQQNNDPPG